MVNGMSQKNYIRAIYKIAVANVLIIFNLNIGTVNLIPNWLGYLLFYDAIHVIVQYEESAQLLKPFVKILGIYELIAWVLACLAISTDSYSIIYILMHIIEVYFYFQLLTNISHIAFMHHYDQLANQLKTLRTLKLISITLFALSWNEYFKIGINILKIILTLWVCVVLLQYVYLEKSEDQKKELAD